MKDLITKLLNIEKKISAEKGSFNLFALFLREDSEDKWELLVSKRINGDEYEFLEYVATNIQNTLTQEELIKISRIVIIDCSNTELDNISKAAAYINRSMVVEHGITELVNCNFFGFIIRHAYIITSKKSCPDLGVNMIIGEV